MINCFTCISSLLSIYHHNAKNKINNIQNMVHRYLGEIQTFRFTECVCVHMSVLFVNGLSVTQCEHFFIFFCQNISFDEWKCCHVWVEKWYIFYRVSHMYILFFALPQLLCRLWKRQRGSTGKLYSDGIRHENLCLHNQMFQPAVKWVFSNCITVYLYTKWCCVYEPCCVMSRDE